MSKIIPLTRGKFAVVDDCDFEAVSAFKWYAQTAHAGGYYAARREGYKGRLIYMHRFIANTPADLVTDHRDGDGLNNRRANLRSATWRQNQMNRRGKKRETSTFKGVWQDSTNPRKPWRAAIRINGHLKYLGRFENEADAGAAYAAAASANFGEFSNSQSGSN